MRYETAGDPMSGLKWTQKTTRKIARELAGLGIHVSHKTVAKLLHQMDFSLRGNRKMIATNTNHSPTARADRDTQFHYIRERRDRFEMCGDPIISVDSKKKEMIGNFKNAGKTWNRKPMLVNDHDFRSDAVGMAVPYGIYDLQANRGKVIVGTSSDTPAFAVNAIERWWKTEGKRRYPTSF